MTHVRWLINDDQKETLISVCDAYTHCNLQTSQLSIKSVIIVTFSHRPFWVLLLRREPRRGPAAELLELLLLLLLELLLELLDALAAGAPPAGDET